MLFGPSNGDSTSIAFADRPNTSIHESQPPSFEHSATLSVPNDYFIEGAQWTGQGDFGIPFVSAAEVRKRDRDTVGLKSQNFRRD
jgi:hypothetical protein